MQSENGLRGQRNKFFNYSITQKLDIMKKFFAIMTVGLLAMNIAAADWNTAGQKVAFGENATANVMAAPQQAPQMAPEDDIANIISERPEGEYVPIEMGVKAYVLSWGQIFGMQAMSKSTHYIINGDDIYLFNPIWINLFNNNVANTYLKGKVVGNEVVVSLPQPYWVNPSNNSVYYANRLVTIEDEEGSHMGVDPDPEVANEIRFEFTDGNLTWVTGDNSVMLGLLDSEGTFGGYCGYDIDMIVHDTTVQTPPENLETEKWVFKSKSTAYFVDLGFDGNDVWVKGFASKYPELWAKGYIDGETVVFPRQYFGIGEDVLQYLYLVGGVNTPDDTDSSLHDLVFSYNADANTMTSPDQILVINPNNIIYYAVESYKAPELYIQSDDISPEPIAPVFTNYMVFSPSSGQGTCQFTLPAQNVDGDLLDPDNFYYRFFINDNELYTLTTEDYSSLTEDITLIPLMFKTSPISRNGNRSNFNFKIPGIEDLGIQSVYYKDGTYYYSPIVYKNKGNVEYVGVNGISADSQVVSTKYYDLSGRQVAHPSGNIYIRCDVMSDGTVKSQKVLVK